MSRTQFNVVAVLAWGAGLALAAAVYFNNGPVSVAVLLLVAFGVAGFSPQLARQWERAIVLRLGRFVGIRGPGVFFLIPFVDRVAAVIDQRVITTTFNAEETLTRDTVPVTVDAVLFWHVHDPERAALEVQDYAGAIARAAQTALRDLIGRTSLADLLVGRETMEHALQDMIDTRIREWGVTVQSVEMRDVVIPTDLQEAMSREAQAEREKNARVILGHAEVLIAEQFCQAGKLYADNPVALHLRAMNILYEGLKEKGALMIVPSTAVESMGLGTFAGLAGVGGYRAGAAGITAPEPAPPAAGMNTYVKTWRRSCAAWASRPRHSRARLHRSARARRPSHGKALQAGRPRFAGRAQGNRPPAARVRAVGIRTVDARPRRLVSDARHRR